MDLDAELASEEVLAEAWDSEEALAEAWASEEALDIPILRGCPTAIPMECHMDILFHRAMAILMEWDMNLSILHQVLPRGRTEKIKKRNNPYKEKK